MTGKSFLKYSWILGLAFLAVLSDQKARAQQEAALQSSERQVIAYYFHTNTRCSTCKKIEEYSREAIEQGFPNELKSGVLEMRLVNYEQPENRRFIRDYKLVSKSLVLVKLANGKQTEWTNLRLVWQLTGRKGAFLNYVRKEVRNYLSKGL